MGLRQADAGPKRIPAFSPFLYRYRNLVERFRAVATRYDKRDDNVLASVRIWSRHNESVG